MRRRLAGGGDVGGEGRPPPPLVQGGENHVGHVRIAATGRDRVGLFRERAPARTAETLGLVEGGFGAGEGGGRVVGVGGQVAGADADRRRDAAAPRFDDAFAHPVHQLDAGVAQRRSARVGDQQTELGAGDAADAIVRTENAGEPLRNLDDNLVGHVESVVGVNGAEIVDAGEEVGAFAPACPRLFEPGFHFAAQMRAVEEAGEFVVDGKPCELRLALLLRLDGTDDRDQPPAFAVADPAAALFNPLLGAFAREAVLADIGFRAPGEGVRAKLEPLAADQRLVIGATGAAAQRRFAEQALGGGGVGPLHIVACRVEFEQRLNAGVVARGVEPARHGESPGERPRRRGQSGRGGVARVDAQGHWAT